MLPVVSALQRGGNSSHLPPQMCGTALKYHTEVYVCCTLIVLLYINIIWLTRLFWYDFIFGADKLYGCISGSCLPASSYQLMLIHTVDEVIVYFYTVCIFYVLESINSVFLYFYVFLSREYSLLNQEVSGITHSSPLGLECETRVWTVSAPFAAH